MRLDLSPEVKQTLLEITKYSLVVWGKKQSQTYLNSFHHKFESIATLPRLGRFLFAQNGIEYRKIAHREHLISYLIINELIFIYALKSHYEN